MVNLLILAEGPSCNRATSTSWQRQLRSLRQGIALLSTAVIVLLDRPAHAMDRHRVSVENNNLHQRYMGVASSKRRRTSSYQTSYHPTPELLWKIQMDGKTLDVSNAVEQSAFDDNVIYITTQEASLAVLSALDGNEIAVIASGAPKSEGWETTCTSGVSFGELEDGTHFLVYSVVDRPPIGSDKTPETRVLAVSIPGHEKLWSSYGLPGESMGSPLVYQTKDRQTYIALTHNSDTLTNATTTIKTGHFTLLRADNGHVVWTESEWRREDTPKGYGPPGIAHAPALGMYHGAEKNENDLVAWASSDQIPGNTFAFQLPMNFRGTENEMSGLGAVVLKVVRWTSISRPIFGQDGSAMYIGAAGNQLRGWTGKTGFDQNADWSQDLSNDATNDSLAIPVAPTLSNDGKRLFVSTSSSEFHCLDAQTGEKLWHVEGASAFLGGAEVSPDDQRVYTIQSIDGRLNAYDQNGGELLWLTSCDAFQEDCANSVKASFALSRTGQYIFYADVLGKVIALKLGDLVWEIDDASSGSGVFLTPGDVFPVKNAPRNESSKSGPSTGGVVALVIFALIVAVAAGAYIMFFHKDKIIFMRRTRGRGHPQASKKDPSNQIPTVPGPDPCTDSKVFSHQNKVTRPQSICLDDSGKVSVHFVEDLSHDRRPMMLSGSNKVAPLAEDFSLGAAVVV